ncbi:BMP family ABC transporter substrate-binding protein [Priestia koreensis]|uniref:BMP family ABC transporter substrate-binding protein n=1 Tax=Priestia koreensis TaxID=284581 RepID=UPI001F593089|nr:BMP family ABC transporter substrate-binding protein [Priestia koreensis]MCM3004849.1 BMP family ABC transporter substrate-binding protein [Priestia koreensis]UNL85645.1 BMP family ABC transporter substrate-binding protein [Priestia koreensis]
MKRPLSIGCIIVLVLFLASCGQPKDGQLKSVGLLVPETINDQVWGTNGYKGMLKIQSTYNRDVFYKEHTDSERAVKQAVKEFSKQGVNLIFGHGEEYASYFNKLGKQYPDIHFVSFNGDAKGDNVTTVNFKGKAMGFFGGMVAGKMTKSKKVGVIAAYDWQPEVKGFLDGVKFQQPNAQVEMKVVKSWDDKKTARQYADEMIKSGVDVVYPAGDGFNVSIIEKLREKGIYAIGYVADQSDLGQDTVLTSTVQHVDTLYELVAKDYDKGTLKTGNLMYDFDNKVISLGKFSPLVDKAYQKEIQHYINEYKRTGKLPDQQQK